MLKGLLCADFVYKAKLDKDSGISAAVQLLAKTPEKMTQIVLEVPFIRNNCYLNNILSHPTLFCHPV